MTHRRQNGLGLGWLWRGQKTPSPRLDSGRLALLEGVENQATALAARVQATVHAHSVELL